jgi:hypothetical protein
MYTPKLLAKCLLVTKFINQNSDNTSESTQPSQPYESLHELHLHKGVQTSQTSAGPAS